MPDSKQDSPAEVSGGGSPSTSPTSTTSTVAPDAPPPEEDTTSDDEPSVGETAEDEVGSPDLDGRRLCPDGACIGVIGADGRCKVCGARPPEAPPAGEGGGEPSPSVAPDSDDDHDGEEPPDLADRRLCSDGACIGVIGADDRCKVCGKPYAGEPEL